MTAIPASGISAWRYWTWTAISLHFLLILLLGLSRHWGYMTTLNDLGIFDQAVWGTLNGDFFLNTINLFSRPANWLGLHFNPILLLFVPLYAIAPAPEWLTLAQALALSLAAWPIFLLASHVSQTEKAGLLWALAYLLNPFLLSAAAWDFHPVALAVPFMALGMLAIGKKDGRLLIWSCIPLLLIQEQLGLAVAGFGLLWRLHHRNWRPAALLILVGLAHGVLVIGLIMPALSPSGNNLMLQSGMGQLSRYGWLGHSLLEVAQTLATRPFMVIRTVASDMGGAAYLALLLLPLLGLPLAAASFILPGMADLAANMLSANPMPRTLFAYHSVTLVPVLTAAAIHGTAKISRHLKKFSAVELAGLAFVASLIAGYRFAPLPLPGSFNFWTPTHFINWPDPVLPEIRAAIGSKAALSAQSNVGAHFSQRRQIFLFPNRVGDADAIVLRLDSPAVPAQGEISPRLTPHLAMWPEDYVASVECLLSGHQYRIALWRAPWLVLARSPIASAAPDQAKVSQQIERLKTQWRLKPERYEAAARKCTRNDS